MKGNRVRHFFIGGRNFQNEFKRQARMLIVITLGFTIAFTWRQTIFDIVQTVVQRFTHLQSAASSTMTSVAITIISVIIIYAASQFLKDRPDHD